MPTCRSPMSTASNPASPSTGKGRSGWPRNGPPARASWPWSCGPPGGLIGHLSWHPVKPVHLRTWELGFIVDPGFQRRGYASEGTRAWTEHAFATLGVHRVVGHCHPDNVASRRTLERAGFVCEGRFRKDVYFRTDVGGRPIWQDTLVYALLDPSEA